MYKLLLQDEGSGASLTQRLLSSMDSMQSEIRELREKLRKLNEFNTATFQTFADTATLEGTLLTAFNQVKQNFGSYSPGKGFPSYNKKNLDWAQGVDSQWGKRQQVIQDYDDTVKKAKNGQDLTEDDVVAIAKYVQKHPNAKLPTEVIDYFSSRTQGEVDATNILEFFKTVLATSAEEISKSKINKIDATIPSIDQYWRFNSYSSPYFGNSISASFDASGYSKHYSSAVMKKWIKALTTSEIDVPVPGTSNTVGISGISSVFIGLDFMENLEDDGSVGRAVAHTAVTTVATSVGTTALLTGVSATAVTVGGATGTAVALSMLSNPVGWAIGAGVVVGLAVNWAYNNNVLGIKDMANQVGDAIDDGIQSVGKAFDSGIKSIQKVFGW